MTRLPLRPLPPPKALDGPGAADCAQWAFAMANPQQPAFPSFFSDMREEPLEGEEPCLKGSGEERPFTMGCCLWSTCFLRYGREQVGQRRLCQGPDQVPQC